MPKVILLSQFSLPYDKIGSWTTLYSNYLSCQHKIDYVICEKPIFKFNSISYSLLTKSFKSKVLKMVYSNPYLDYFNALERLIDKDDKFIIQIIDNYGLMKPLHNYLVKRGVRSKFYIQFFYHGFAPFYENFEGRSFFLNIDEMVVLTKDSYVEHKNYYTVLPTIFSVLHNGIDTAKFETISKQNKLLLKRELGIEDKKIFLWCSQDRPKKGLTLILNAWSKVYSENQNIILLIIGCEPRSALDGVQFLGIIPNDELPKYYQTADCYLFPTLCHEGFGMSLIEALHCGCYCIASKLGGVPEVLEYGKYGKLIENPHFVAEWVDAINEFLEGELSYPPLPKELYSTNAWNDGMNTIIEEAKIRLDTRIAK